MGNIGVIYTCASVVGLLMAFHLLCYHNNHMQVTSISWKENELNMVDTPGHADFGGEVCYLDSFTPRFKHSGIVKELRNYVLSFLF